MPRIKLPKTRLLSFEKLNDILHKRGEQTPSYPRSCMARIASGYYAKHLRGAHHISICHHTKNQEGWKCVDVAAGPSGSSVYVLPYTCRNTALRPSYSRSRRLWTQDKVRWSPYRPGDEVTTRGWQAAYLALAGGDIKQITLDEAERLICPASPPFARRTHSEWMLDHPQQLRIDENFSSSVRRFTATLEGALRETPFEYIIERSPRGPARLLVTAPPTMRRRACTLSLRIAQFTPEARKAAGVSVEWALRHYQVEAYDGAHFSMQSWPSFASAVRGVCDWLAEKSLYIPGPSLC